MSYKDWLENNPPALDMLPEQQKKFRQQIIAGCIGIGDCWVWKGAKTSTGYGNIRVDYAIRTVSRLALCLHTGASLSMEADACHIPECPSRACCNPAHLFWDDHQKNCSDREARDARWDRYVNAMEPGGTDVFVVFEKRYKPGWGWLDCRSVQPLEGNQSELPIKRTAPNTELEDSITGFEDWQREHLSRIILQPMPNQSMMLV